MKKNKLVVISAWKPLPLELRSEDGSVEGRCVPFTSWRKMKRCLRRMKVEGFKDIKITRESRMPWECGL